MDLLNTHSTDYFYGRISILNDFDTAMNHEFAGYLNKAFTNYRKHNYARKTKLVRNDTIHNADYSFWVKGEADWALTDHLFDIFLVALTKDERKRFYNLLLSNPKIIFIDLNEYEPERFMLHEITGYLAAYRDDAGNPTVYIKDYYYDEFDFTAYNRVHLGFERGIYENSSNYFKLAKELFTSKPVNSIWKLRYHRDRMDLLFGLRALIRGKDHQGAILLSEIKDTKYFLAKLNKALIRQKRNQ